MNGEELSKVIRGRGHWVVVVRPERHNANRVPYEKMMHVVERSQITSSGWYFPHINNERPRRGSDFIEQCTQVERFIEFWRMYRSGQFYAMNAISEDWLDRPGSFGQRTESWAPGRILNVYHLVRRYVEVFEFTERLAQTDAGDEKMHVSITISKLQDRHLVLGPERELDGFKFSLEEWIDEQVYEREAPAEPIDFGLERVRELTKRAGWSPPLSLLRDILRETRHPR